MAARIETSMGQGAWHIVTAPITLLWFVLRVIQNTLLRSVRLRLHYAKTPHAQNLRYSTSWYTVTQMYIIFHFAWELRPMTSRNFLELAKSGRPEQIIGNKKCGFFVLCRIHLVSEVRERMPWTKWEVLWWMHHSSGSEGLHVPWHAWSFSLSWLSSLSLLSLTEPCFLHWRSHYIYIYNIYI